MPYAKPWNESVPDGDDLVADLDTVVQDFKIAVRERLEDVIPGFSNDAVQPKTLAASALTPTGVQRAKASVTGQGIPTNTPTLISFTDEEYDEGEMWSLIAPTQMVCKEDGIYLITGTILWDDGAHSADPGRLLTVRKNKAGDPSVVIAGSTGLNFGTQDTVESWTWVGQLVVGEYITVTVHHPVAATINVDANIAMTRIV